MVGFGSVQSVMCLVAQWCPTLCDTMDCSLPGSSIHGIFQARILEWVAISFSSDCHSSDVYMIWYVVWTEKAMAPHSSTLAWKIPWTEEPSRLQSMGSRRVGYDWASSLLPSCIGEGNGNPLQCSCLENPMDRGAWRATVHGVTKSWTWLSN